MSRALSNFKRNFGRVWHGPWDWLVENTTARDRRSFGGWTLVACIIGSFFFGRAVLWVTILSLVALIPNVSSETPVEEEGGET